MVAPPVGLGDLALRERMISPDPTVQRDSAGPRSRSPCGPAEDGLPASIQIVGRPGDDALVLAVGDSAGAALPRSRVLARGGLVGEDDRLAQPARARPEAPRPRSSTRASTSRFAAAADQQGDERLGVQVRPARR